MLYLAYSPVNMKAGEFFTTPSQWDAVPGVPSIVERKLYVKF
jgi:hypothetical protein